MARFCFPNLLEYFNFHTWILKIVNSFWCLIPPTVKNFLECIVLQNPLPICHFFINTICLLYNFFLLINNFPFLSLFNFSDISSLFEYSKCEIPSFLNLILGFQNPKYNPVSAFVISFYVSSCFEPGSSSSGCSSASIWFWLNQLSELGSTSSPLLSRVFANSSVFFACKIKKF